MKNKRDERIGVFETLVNIIFVIKYLFHINKRLFFVRIPLLCLQTLSSIASMFFLKVILNSLGDKNIKIETIIIYTTVFSIVTIAISALNRILANYDKRQLEESSFLINLSLGQAISQLPLSEVEKPRMKDFIERAASSNSFSTVIDYTTGFIGAVINVITYATTVIMIQPVILYLIFFVVIVQIILKKLNQKRSYKYRVLEVPVYRKFNYYCGILSDWRYGKEVRTGNLQDYFLSKSEQQFNNEIFPLSKKGSSVDGILCFLENLVFMIQKFAIYIILGAKVVFQNMLIGDFSLYLTSADKLTNSLSGLVGCYANLMTCGIFAKEFKYCIELSKNKNASNCEEIDFRNNHFSIEFKNVSFKYPDTDIYVLKNISFTLHSGECLSLVGVNGSGKSTLVKLICRFYEPTEGDIFIGGINTKYIPYNKYAQMISAVFQDFKLFSFSVRENITMETNTDNSKLHFSIKNSGLNDKIINLKNGIETYINKEFDESGVEFSGGECQKVAIARAIYKDAPILILDEPTAALDPISEYEIYQKFNNLSKGKTAIYISHRLTSTRFTDKIAVIENGELKEFGSHESLMKLKNGIYRNMFQMQAQYYI